ncbi:MAG: hypothetical protein B7Z43_00935 [Sphingomonas sp. 12-62-6]|nr:MAG: hypothetical protein B7Z43_00935 [Sphingomonas sp. 12-62-6]
MRYLVSLLVLIALPGIAPAQDPASVAVEPTKPAKVKRPKKICKSDPRSASRIAATICKTKEEWEGVSAVEGTDGTVRGNRAN